MKKVVIIGAGIGGIATAALLSKQGYDVTVYERHSSAGGRAGQLQTDGFVFDTGPSWYLMPEVFERYYTLLDESIDDHLTLRRLDPAYKVFFEGDTDPITIHADLKRDMQTFESIEPGAGDRLGRYVEQSETAYTLALKHFLYTNFDKPLQFIKRDIVGSSARLLRSLFEPIDRLVSRSFRDQRLKQIMEYPMVFLGSSPFEAPSLYSLMSYIDFKQGVFYPQGGLYEVITSLKTLAEKHGATFVFDQDVTSIRTSGGHASGITLNGNVSVTADIVISNADLHFTETTLLPPAAQTYSEAYWSKKQAGPSAILMYLGVKGALPNLQHHNLLFVDAWRDNFASIFRKKSWPDTASIYVCNPSTSDPSTAPDGYENLFVLVPGPAQVDDSEETIAALADQYLGQIATMIDVPDLSDRIVTKKIVGPYHFSDAFSAWNGTALGLSHVLKQSAMFRPRNKSKKVDNLYYVGANTVPGIGLPMCLIGAELVAKRLEQQEGGQ